MLSRLFAVIALEAFILPFSSAYAQDPSITPMEEFMRANVVDILNEHEDRSFEGFTRTVQTVRLRMTSGPEKGKEITIENGVLDDRADMRLSDDETVVLRKFTNIEGETTYLIAEKYRLPALLWLGMFFFGLTLLFGGWMGLSSLAGLTVSILILALFVVPGIAAGKNPMVISLIGSFGIACTSLTLAHGFNRRTFIALLSTLVTLAIAVVLSVVFVSVTKLFGMGSEESMFLQIGSLQQINLQGLLLGGIIIGCLGVLDDITTAQTAAIAEIKRANPSLTSVQLLRAGLSIGREHIASLVNTLALAYAGASLPLLLLFQINEGYPFWVTLNSEFLAEEIIRTLVGSSTLLFAVPISTWFAATMLSSAGSPSDRGGHGHARGPLPRTAR